MNKKIFYLLLSSLLVFPLAACSSGSDTSKDSSDSGKQVQEEQPKEEQKPKNTAGINEIAEADGLQLVVTSAQTNGGAEFVTPEDGKIFLVVHVKATNAGDNKVDVNPYYFKLDVNGVEQDVDFSGSMLDGITQIDAVTLKNGATTEGDLVFQVPADYNGGAILEYYSNVFNDDPSILINL